MSMLTLRLMIPRWRGNVTVQLLDPAECYHTQSSSFSKHCRGVPNPRMCSFTVYKFCLFLCVHCFSHFFPIVSADSSLSLLSYFIFKPHLSPARLFPLIFPYFLFFLLSVLLQSKPELPGKHRLKAYVLALQSHCSGISEANSIQLAFSRCQGKYEYKW